jgi:lipid-A-disaccharide synthase
MDFICDSMIKQEDTIPILLAAGETSGEAHAAGLIRELRKQFPANSLEFFGSGGEKMKAEGAQLLLDVSKLGAIGPWAALANAGNYLWLYRELVKQAQNRQTRLAILVDFPEFNLRLAGKLTAMGIPVCYFIGPQVWAWRSSRVKQIKRYVDLMLVILPFEEAFYKSHGISAHYVGNPSASQLRSLVRRAERERAGRVSPHDESLVALLPGSREQEVELIMPVMLDAARYLEERHPTRFVLVKAPAISGKSVEKIYRNWAKEVKSDIDLKVFENNSHQILCDADCAIVKSGTSTLEAMITETPFAMVYRISTLSWLLLRPFVQTDTYCLANLVAGQKIVPEFIQKNATGEQIGAYMLSLMQNPEEKDRVRHLLSQASRRLGEDDAYVESARKIASRFF